MQGSRASDLVDRGISDLEGLSHFGFRDWGFEISVQARPLSKVKAEKNTDQSWEGRISVSLGSLSTQLYD